MRFETDVTRLFGIKYPIVAGGLQWLANADYVAAASRAGIIGFITAASFADPEDLKAEIRKCRDLSSGGPFGVNVSMLPKLVPGEKTEDLFRLIIDEGVRFVETSGRNPAAFLPLLKDAGVKVLHKVPAVRYAEKAQAEGVDMVSIVGAECGGHPGQQLIGSMVNLAMAQDRLTIPFLIGGGIGHGAQIASALVGGAGGVVIGTRFLVASEIPAHPGYGETIRNASESDTALIMHSVRNTMRALANDTTAEVAELERVNPEISIQDLLPLVSGQISRSAYQTGDLTKGVFSAGQALAFANDVRPLKEIVQELAAQTERAAQRANELFGDPA